jgi:hypothetical protein
MLIKTQILNLEEEVSLLCARLATVESWIRKVSQSAVINLK